VNYLERFESVAQKYVRAAPVAFDKARGAELFDESGNRYIDFHSGRGALSHGHNDIKVCTALIDHLCNDRIIQTRDRTSVAKRNFVEAFVTSILQPRKLDYKILFTDPASGSAVEVALRLARHHKKRSKIVSFTNCWHGLTEGARSVTSKPPARNESLDLRSKTAFMPYCAYFGEPDDTVAYLRRHILDSASGLDLPAGIIVETAQVEGGVRIASTEWLKGLERLCREFGILLIVDETQTGCGRTGPYFSFERAGLTPDMVIVSSATAGGLPMSMLLIRPEIDQCRQGEDIGIFQGNSLAFVAATELLSQWANGKVGRDIGAREKVLSEALEAIPARYPDRGVSVRGIGMAWGIDFGRTASAAVVSAWALERGLIVEPAWIKDEVLLVLPPVTIPEPVLREGLEHLHEAVAMFLAHQ
jgi:diaminobutyrate-2-oxoglutarate transaminase